MSDYTPNLATAESAYVNWALLGDRGIDAVEAADEFDRFIAKVRAESYNAGFDDGFNANPDHQHVQKIKADALRVAAKYFAGGLHCAGMRTTPEGTVRDLRRMADLVEGKHE